MCVKLADYFSWARLVLYFPITYFAYTGQQIWVLVLFLIAMLTDFFDGFIARKTKTASQAGAILDSRIDTIGFFFYMAWLWLLFRDLFLSYWWAIVIIVFLELVPLILSYWRLGKITGTHLWSGKCAAVAAVVLLPALIVFGEQVWLIWIVIIIAVIASIEGILFFILNKKNLDAKSIFSD